MPPAAPGWADTDSHTDKAHLFRSLQFHAFALQGAYWYITCNPPV